MPRLRFLALLVLPLPLLAATLRVNNAPDTSPDHTTIQAAIDAAADGDTLLIEGSATPYAGFTLDNKRLNLIGPGYRLGTNLGTPANKLGALIDGGSCYIRNSSASTGANLSNGSLIMGLEFTYDLRLESSCSNITVARCHFDGNRSGRLYIDGPSNVVTQCLFSGTSSNLYLNATASGSRIENCILSDTEPQIMTSSGTRPVFTLRNNIFYHVPSLYPTGVSVNFENNIFLSPTSSAYPGATFLNNLFLGSIPSSIIGSGNISYSTVASLMPDFNSSAASIDSRFRLTTTVPPTGGSTNPALNAGTDGTHIGPFGGTNPYVLSGVPPLPTIDELSIPQFASPGGDLTIRIKVGERP